MARAKEVGTKWWYAPPRLGRLYQVQIATVTSDATRISLLGTDELVWVYPEQLFATKNGARNSEARRLKEEINNCKRRALNAENMAEQLSLELERVMIMKPYKAEKDE